MNKSSSKHKRDTCILATSFFPQQQPSTTPAAAASQEGENRRSCSSSASSSSSTPSRLALRRSLLKLGFGQVSTYEKLNILGAGNYSTVYKGRSRLTNKLVALKEINVERDEGVPFTAIREVSLLKSLKHNNIITLHDIIYTGRTLTLVIEFVERDLSHYLNECDHNLNMHNVRLFLYQLLRGLKYCHDRRVLHRDLKPQNILINSHGVLKLADFGLARAKSLPTKTFTNEVVTLWYRAPDVLLGNVEYSTSIDIWGVGCIFFEMATGYAPFQGLNSRKQIESIFEIIGTPNEHKWPGFRDDLEKCFIKLPNFPGRDLRSLAPRLDNSGIDLLRRMLTCNPHARIAATEAMTHQYFSSILDRLQRLPDCKSIFSVPSIRLAEEAISANGALSAY